MATSLITQESSALIAEVRSFLESTVTDIEISDEVQKANATTLGNELQKKSRVIEDARKKEKSVWDKKTAEVQAEFKPVLELIEQKKRILGSAITKYNRVLEDRRASRQLELDAETANKRAALEAFAGKREERLEMYKGKLNEANAEIGKMVPGTDPQAYNTLANHIRYLQQKCVEFADKVADTVKAAATVVAPVYQPEPTVAAAGTRVTMEAVVRITDFPVFVKWCSENQEEQFLIHDEAKLKQRVKEKEGRFCPPGTATSYQLKTGFSGR
jgi:hypothetical protein